MFRIGLEIVLNDQFVKMGGDLSMNDILKRPVGVVSTNLATLEHSLQEKEQYVK